MEAGFRVQWEIKINNVEKILVFRTRQKGRESKSQWEMFVTAQELHSRREGTDVMTEIWINQK